MIVDQALVTMVAASNYVMLFLAIKLSVQERRRRKCVMEISVLTLYLFLQSLTRLSLYATHTA